MSISVNRFSLACIREVLQNKTDNQISGEIVVLSRIIQDEKLSCWSSVQNEDAIFWAKQIVRCAAQPLAYRRSLP